MHWLDLRQLLGLVVIGGGFAFTGVLLGGAWLLGRYRGKEEELSNELATVDARLQRMEYILSQTTNAVERLEAVQRHTVTLIADGSINVPRLPGRQVTPH